MFCKNGYGKGLTMYKKILAVDDDDNTLELLSEVLNRYGYNVKTLAKAENVFRTVTTFQPDLILLDVMLAGLDGSVICSALKATPETQHIPVICISGNYTAAGKVYSDKELAPNDFVLKPFNIKALISKIEHQLAA